MAGFLVKSFGGCCGNTVLTGARRLSVSTELNHKCSLLVLDSDNGVCCHHSLHSSHQGSPTYGPRAMHMRMMGISSLLLHSNRLKHHTTFFYEKEKINK